MSVGAVDPTQPLPFDPEVARLAAMQPPPPIPPVAIPTVPPAAPTGIDSVNPGAVADQIAAVGNPSTPPLPPPIPTAPGAPSPQTPITPVPPGAPAATAAGTPETPKQTDELKAAQTEAQKAREDSDKARIDLQKAGQPAVDEQKQIREQQVRDQQESLRLHAEQQQKYQSAEDAADKQIAASQAAIKGFKFRDYFADGNGGTNWALKIGTALSAAIGAFGAGLTHGPNYALQILNKNMDDAHQHQLDELGKMKDEEVMQRTGLQDIRAARAKANADLTVNDAARDKLVAAQLNQAAARKESAQFAPSLTAASAKLKQEAAEKDAAAKAALVQLNLKLADEGRKKAVDESTIAKNTAEAGLANKKTEVGGFAPHKGAGGGGGAASPAQGAAAATLSDMIGKGAAYTDLVAKANELHFPLDAKAGHTSLKSLISGAGATGANAARTAHADTAETADVDKRFEAIRREVSGPKGPLTQLQRLNGMTSVVDNAIKTGDKTAATAILEEAGGMLSGGKSTRTTVELLEKLQSMKDEAAEKWGHLTGDPGASKAFTGRLNGLLNGVKEEKRRELDDIRQGAINTEMGEHGLSKEGKRKERALGHLGLFDSVTNANGSARYGAGGAPAAAPAIPPGAKVGTKGGVRGYQGTDGVFHAL